MSAQETAVAIIGAGPAGLTAAYMLGKAGIPCIILEADPHLVGGISRTVSYKGCLFDIGGHRFFSKSAEVEALWKEILPDGMLERPRSSRIYYRGKFFAYPIAALDALMKLGIWESIRCGLSYLKARLMPVARPASFQDWVSNHFGARLFEIFFKTYTEKVWGMSCRDISADWAAQRIKGLSLSSAIWNALWPRRQKSGSAVIKTLINTFRYPKRGPGMMWEACAAKITAQGGRILMGHRFIKGDYDAATQRWTITHRDTAGNLHALTAQHLISSAPIADLIPSLSPALPAQAKSAAKALRYRDFLTVVLMYRHQDAFPDNWLYIHDPSVKVGRIQNFKSWSPDMVPDPNLASYGLEYFCFEGDGLWTSSDADLLALAKAEMEQLGLAKATDWADGCVVRQAKAYPVYDASYATHVSEIRQAIATHLPRLHLVGRNGMHKYNNQDHSMMTAMLCARNIIHGSPLYDLWQVNQDAEYHEGNSADQGGRLVPAQLPGTTS
ncbi:NAD(P)/FAD-dependent oxidoreductase [Prosthecobacter sp.]|uniref:NAD(P)/FAD-dependent oxidoreductase n=1 Tax=Prosthecobacter sp. TaxID=1965333 RepID=UPI003784C9D4